MTSNDLPPYDYKTREYKRYVHAVLSGGDFSIELRDAEEASVRYVHSDQPPTPLRTPRTPRPSGWSDDGYPLPAGYDRPRSAFTL